MTRFTERVAIVTGAAQGMGFAIAARLASDGARVILADINAGGLARAREELAQWSDATETVEVDVTRASDVTRMVARAAEQFGPVDILVNNAGVLRSSRVEHISEAEWDLVVNLNLGVTP